MDLPKIDLSFLPDLDTLTGIFGSIGRNPGHDDTVIVMMTYVYDAFPPQSML